MTDIEERLRRDAVTWRAGLRMPSIDAALDRLPARRSGRRPAIAAAAAIVALLVAIIALAWPRTSHSRPVGRPTSNPLYGVTWLDQIAQATVVFRPGVAHTTDGCAGGSNRLTVTGDRLRLGVSVGPQYVCGGTPGPRPGDPGYADYLVRWEALNRFYAILRSAPRWSVDGHVLTLRGPDGSVVQLTSDGTAAITLPGSRWVLEFVTTPVVDRGLTASLEGPRLTFDRSGGFRATDSCTQFGGTATITTNTIVFRRTDASAGTAGCAPTGRFGRQLVNAVDTMLSRTVHYVIEGNVLRISDIGTDGQLVYRPAP